MNVRQKGQSLFIKLMVIILIVPTVSVSLTGCLKQWNEEEVKSWYDEKPDSFDGYMAASRKMVSEGRADKAQEYLKDAIKMIDSQFGPEDIRVATACDELAYLQEQAGDYKSAEDTYRRALKARASLPPNSADVVKTKKALANALMKLFRLEEAQKILKELKGGSKAGSEKNAEKGNGDKKVDSKEEPVTRRKRQIN